MSRDTIILGALEAPIATFSGDDIGALVGHNAVDVIGDQLSVDTLNPSVWQRFIAPVVYKPLDYGGILTADGKIYCCHYEGQNLIKAAPYGTKIFWQRNGKIRGRYYVEKIVRGMAEDGQDVWDIQAISLIGLLDKQDHAGNVYSGQLLVEVAAEILGGTIKASAEGYVISGGAEDVLVEPALGEMKIYGWLPYASRRQNLHQLLFVSGISLCRDGEGSIQLKRLSMANPAQIEADRLYIGGSVEYDAAFTGVELTEHSYQWAYNAAPSTLFDNSDAYSEPAVSTLVRFSNPVKADSVYTEGGLSVEKLGTNYAIVSGKGTLKGIAYAHITRTISKHLETDVPANVHSVTGVTLVNALNSENVLERIYRLHTQAFVHSVDVDVQEEKTGGAYSLTNVTEPVTGIVSDMELVSESVLKAACQIVTGYEPGPFGNNFNNSALMTGSGTWTVPQSVRQSDFPFIRITLVGAGGGGDGGEGGQQGRGSYPTGNFDAIGEPEYTGNGGGRGGKGGKGGAPGIPGKVVTIAKLDVTDIARIVYSCGVGGTKGKAGTGGYYDVDPIAPGLGTVGGETVLRLYNDAGSLVRTISTADGVILPSGVLDLPNDTVYGLEGLEGIAGGDAGMGGAAAQGAAGADGESVTGRDGTVYPGGLGSLSAYEVIQATDMQAYAGGGSGGGAADGTPGGDAPTEGRGVSYAGVWGGDGGHGATPAKAPEKPEAYGQSGDGGPGGGGGGTGGAQNWRYPGTETGYSRAVRDGLVGPGGNGRDGAPGADGCWFCYY